MRKALSSLPGVEKVDIDFSKKTATVSHKDSATVEGMISAIKEKGFKASVQ